jgi:hypothetical protein
LAAGTVKAQANRRAAVLHSRKPWLACGRGATISGSLARLGFGIALADVLLVQAFWGIILPLEI